MYMVYGGVQVITYNIRIAGFNPGGCRGVNAPPPKHVTSCEVILYIVH